MTFNDVAIHDGGVAGLESSRRLMLTLNGRQVEVVDRLNRKPGVLQVRDPVATAASGRRFVNDDSLCVGGGRRCLARRRRLAAARCSHRKQRQQDE